MENILCDIPGHTSELQNIHANDVMNGIAADLREHLPNFSIDDECIIYHRESFKYAKGIVDIRFSVETSVGNFRASGSVFLCTYENEYLDYGGCVSRHTHHVGVDGLQGAIQHAVREVLIQLGVLEWY